MHLLEYVVNPLHIHNLSIGSVDWYTVGNVVSDLRKAYRYSYGNIGVNGIHFVHGVLKYEFMEMEKCPRLP